LNDVEEKMLRNDKNEKGKELEQKRTDSPWCSGEIGERREW